MPEFVRLQNDNEETIDEYGRVRPPAVFDFHHRNVKKLIPPGKDTIVPWDLAVTLFGDPYLVDSPRDPARKTGLKLARNNFGYSEGIESDAEFDARRAHISVWNVETSPQERIFMLIEDPDNLKFQVPQLAAQDEGSEGAMFAARLAQMQATIDQLVNVISSQGVIAQAATQTSPEQQAVMVPPAPQGQTTFTSQDAGPLPLQPQTQEELANHASVMAQFAAQAGINSLPDDTAPAQQVVETAAIDPAQLSTLQSQVATPEQIQAQQQERMRLAAELAAQQIIAVAHPDGPGGQPTPTTTQAPALKPRPALASR